MLPEHLNDSRIGRVLDQLYDYGVTQLFVQIALAVVSKFDIQLKCAHLDATTISVQGQYLQKGSAQEASEPAKGEVSETSNGQIEPSLSSGAEEDAAITITHGYSRAIAPISSSCRRFVRQRRWGNSFVFGRGQWK